MLYTHQKSKKSKTWQDGFLRYPSSCDRKGTLVDDTGSTLDALYVKSASITVGEQYEASKYLVSVEEAILISEAGTRSSKTCARESLGVDLHSIEEKAVPKRKLEMTPIVCSPGCTSEAPPPKKRSVNDILHLIKSETSCDPASLRYMYTKVSGRADCSSSEAQDKNALDRASEALLMDESTSINQHYDIGKPVISRSRKSLFPVVQRCAEPYSSRSCTLVFPSRSALMLASAPPRQVVIPFTFETAGHYKTVLMNAVTEHLNVILYGLALKYHRACTAVDITCISQAGSSTSLCPGGSQLSEPRCQHGPAHLRTVRKEGCNKGRAFYCCGASRSSQCQVAFQLDASLEPCLVSCYCTVC